MSDPTSLIQELEAAIVDSFRGNEHRSRVDPHAECVSQLTARLAVLSAFEERDILSKLTVLSIRLRSELTPGVEGPVLDYLLAEGARDDLAYWLSRRRVRDFG